MNIDLFVASKIYEFNRATNNFFTPFLKWLTEAANLGLIFIILSLIMLIFKKTRRVGAEILVSLALGTLIVLVMKNIIKRDRPFINTESDYYRFYTFAGSLKQSGYSFPSGHTCAAASFGVILFIKYSKKYSYIYLLIPLIFGFSRIYFNVHYFSDVFVGLIIGLFSGVLVFILSNKLCSKYFNKTK